MNINYAEIRHIPFRVALAHYGIELVEKHISGDVKLQGRCPLHTDGIQARTKNHLQITLVSPKNPQTNNTFHCFACHARGTVTDFVVLMEGKLWLEKKSEHHFPTAHDVDWHRVKESRARGDDWNWCPKEKLKEASRLLHDWFETAKNNGAWKPNT